MQCTEPPNGPATLDFQRLGDSVRDSYRHAAAKYRSDDEIEITTEHHRHLGGLLRQMSAAFSRPIDVLEAGCGTGRYFHCLKNVEHLTGIDVSEEMLAIANHPVREEEVSIGSIDLRCVNIYFAGFQPASFDMIYSLGMFGNGCPVTVEICNHFYDWLKPGGKLFFNTISTDTLPFPRRLRRNVRNAIYPWLPQSLKAKLDARSAGVQFFGMSQRELKKVMQASRFRDFSITSHASDTQLWKGVQLECMASKPAA